MVAHAKTQPLYTRIYPAVNVTVTPTLDTNAYAAGDILFNPTEVASVTLESAGYARLVGLSIFDGDAQAAALDLYILQASTSLGTINTAPNITDANLDPPNFQHVVSFVAADWANISGASVISWSHEGDGLPCVSSGTSMYIAALTQGTPTHTASGMVITTWWVR